jgi:hypothetical protein
MQHKCTECQAYLEEIVIGDKTIGLICPKCDREYNLAGKPYEE